MVQLLHSKNKDDMGNPLWGIFLPDICYNMDQVPFPFVVNQDSTLTTHDDNEIPISAPSDALRNIQFTIHVVVNVVEGDKLQGFVDIFCKGTGKRIYKTEQNILYARSKVFSRIIHGLIPY